MPRTKMKLVFRIDRGVRGVFDDHHVGGFDQRADLIADFELQRFDRAARDYGVDEVVTHLHRDLGENVADVDFQNRSLQLVAPADLFCHFTSPRKLSINTDHGRMRIAEQVLW